MTSKTQLVYAHILLKEVLKDIISKKIETANRQLLSDDRSDDKVLIGLDLAMDIIEAKIEKLQR